MAVRDRILLILKFSIVSENKSFNIKDINMLITNIQMITFALKSLSTEYVCIYSSSIIFSDQMLLKLNETTIEITDQVLLILKKYVQDKGQNESGGILLGGYIPSENKYDFVAVSEPCSSDQSGPAYFIRNKENAQRVINQHCSSIVVSFNFNNICLINPTCN